MIPLHVFANDVTDWYVAETAEEAEQLWRQYNFDVCGLSEDDLDIEMGAAFEQEPDDKVLSMRSDGDGKIASKTCAEWAHQNGKGFLGSTEY